ncbi:MAG: hypothetical protein AAF358_13130 [Pseudomonadota bacterium]
MTDIDRELSNAVNTIVEQRSSGLDAATLSRLNRARQQALDDVRHESRGRWLPGGLAAGAAVVAVAIGLTGRVPPPAQPLLEQPVSDFTVLASDESLEMLENLEFYAWLDEVLTEAEAG